MKRLVRNELIFCKDERVKKSKDMKCTIPDGCAVNNLVNIGRREKNIPPKDDPS